MKTDHPLPDAALKGHIAVVGMTGGGKTFTTKGIVEHILAKDPAARVCVLDPIKSDWWGITSSANGKRPGLPFHILGGPRGHVPLHETTGKAIGELVGSGSLPLSIVDMADFGPGGLQAFFNDFAPALLRRIRGVVHLVLEEAHEFAPKERAGFGGETMTVHFAKKLATAGRSKGIRIIAATQRTQQLHNSVLGSCQTVIAHQLTYPADIEPVSKWFKGHVDKEVFGRFLETLTSLPTGTGWMCSGQAKVAEMVRFPAIWTFDNSATPDGAADIDVTTAPVDRDKLRQIMGDAAKEAEDNDVPTLRKRIKELEAELAKKPAATVDEAALEEARTEGHRSGAAAALRISQEVISTINGRVAAMHDVQGRLVDSVSEAVTAIELALKNLPAGRPGPGIAHRPAPFVPQPSTRIAVSSTRSGDPSTNLPKAERLILTVLAQRHPERVPVDRIAAIAGYSAGGGGFNNALSSLRGKAFIEQGPSPLAITADGLTALGQFDPLPTGAALLTHWMNRVGKAERAILEAASRGLTSKDAIASAAGYAPDGGGFNNALGRLRTLGLIVGRGTIELHEDLR